MPKKRSRSRSRDSSVSTESFDYLQKKVQKYERKLAKKMRRDKSREDRQRQKELEDQRTNKDNAQSSYLGLYHALSILFDYVCIYIQSHEFPLRKEISYTGQFVELSELLNYKIHLVAIFCFSENDTSQTETSEVVTPKEVPEVSTKETPNQTTPGDGSEETEPTPLESVTGLSTESNINKTQEVADQVQKEKEVVTIDLDKDILEILGDDPTNEIKYGPEIHKEIATRFEHIATLGLSKENRKEIMEKYLTPANCTRSGAPLLNPEIKAAISETVIKRDKGIEAKQKQLATAIAGLGKVISAQMCATNRDTELVKDLMNTGRILCDLQHAESDQLTDNKIDKFLFGENLAETLKAAKAVSKSSTALTAYIRRTKDLRSTKDLFISYRKPFGTVTTQTISRWIKLTLKDSGLDVTTFSAHSTRHASTSKAHKLGVNIDEIRKTAGWSGTSNTFGKFYNRIIVAPNKGSLARAIINEPEM
ncbi:Protein of unknown function [Cotesia congregata]|uniref:Tyr recombinase domain-containing protein n=1 Tax=Cotesia congregata TaxID=51543 RepID=A0A8J2MTX6_COTCN|nr:Protein of unknown function [Cotesia congregata]